MPVAQRVPELCQHFCNFWIHQIKDFPYLSTSSQLMICLSHVLVIVLARVLVAYVRRFRGSYGIPRPPGPCYWIPYLGHLPFIQRKSLHLSLSKMAAKYGPFYAIQLGSTKMVVLSDVAIVKKMFDRPKKLFGNPTRFVNTSLTNAYGMKSTDCQRLLADHQRFSSEALNLFSTRLWDNGTPFDLNVQQKLNYFINDLISLSSRNTPVIIQHNLRSISANLMSAVLFGRDVISDCELSRQMENANMRQNEVETLDMINYFPFLRLFQKYQKAYSKRMSDNKELIDVLNRIVRNSRYIDGDYSSSNVISGYRLEWRRRISNNMKGFGDERLWLLLADQFSAGTQTMASTLLWSVVHLVQNRDAMQQAQAEMDSVISRRRNPQLEDMDRVPYTCALILECQRLGNVLPLGFPLATKNNEILHGYFVEKGTIVITLLAAIHTDPKYWSDPESFRPERFLDDDGQLKSRDEFMPYGCGPLGCPGIAIAKASLFMILATLLHRFDISLPEGASSPGTNPDFGVTLEPEDFCVNLLTRDVTNESIILSPERNFSPVHPHGL